MQDTRDSLFRSGIFIRRAPAVLRNRLKETMQAFALQLTLRGGLNVSLGEKPRSIGPSTGKKVVLLAIGKMSALESFVEWFAIELKHFRYSYVKLN